ncbi:hypothetical protein VY88_27975 [Azospirillum thiophilum]|uniref:Acyltransferase 3 domain-containing protein n=1 Tax=Azospirillum thiophilum TaxID=528244 RepID=A0AAC8W5S2_9PROT|nr:hypothetical protein [Azospirillum thiophilum]ALG75649.1 hypothetical protein AL072_32570 [Azospirillum thiophilum]KJR61991.1 hypothetical protein VY88_27975 [Azospirillum thiophilum]
MLLAFMALESAKALSGQAGNPPGNAAFTGAFAPSSLISNLALVHGLGMEDRLSWNIPSWSIGAEFFVYITFAILLLAMLAAAGDVRLYQAAHGRRMSRHAGRLAEAGALLTVVVFVSAAGGNALPLAAPLLFGPVVLVFAFEAGPVSRLLTTSPFRQLAAWPYSIYMVHALLIAVLQKATTVAQEGIGRPLFVERRTTAKPTG